MKAKEKAKKKPRSLKVPKSVQDSIPYHMVYPEMELSRRSRGISATHISSRIATFLVPVKQNKSICSIAMVSF